MIIKRKNAIIYYELSH